MAKYFVDVHVSATIETDDEIFAREWMEFACEGRGKFYHSFQIAGEIPSFYVTRSIQEEIETTFDGDEGDAREWLLNQSEPNREGLKDVKWSVYNSWKID